MAPLKTWFPVCSASTLKKGGSNGTRSIQTLTKIIKFCQKDVMRGTYGLFCYPQRTNRTAACTFKGIGTPACTVSRLLLCAQPRQLHRCMQVSRQLLVQLIKCSCTAACCCNLLKIAKRQLHLCGHNFKTTATLCAQF
jgi:hypothetical protein